jgi:hypothetical protein
VVDQQFHSDGQLHKVNLERRRRYFRRRLVAKDLWALELYHALSRRQLTRPAICFM